MSEYKSRDGMALDEAGGYYIKHVAAMTSEGLHHKNEIAGELAYRDCEIDRLAKENEALTVDLRQAGRQIEALKYGYPEFASEEKMIMELRGKVKTLESEVEGWSKANEILFVAGENAQLATGKAEAEVESLDKRLKSAHDYIQEIDP